MCFVQLVEEQYGSGVIINVLENEWKCLSGSTVVSTAGHPRCYVDSEECSIDGGGGGNHFGEGCLAGAGGAREQNVPARFDWQPFPMAIEIGSSKRDDLFIGSNLMVKQVHSPPPVLALARAGESLPGWLEIA